MCLLFSSLSPFWFFWPTWSGIQFNIFSTVVPITTKQELLSIKCSLSTHAHILMHVCVHAHLNTHLVHVCLLTHTCAFTHIHIHMYKHPHVHMRTFTHSCTHTHAYMCICTDIHLCAYAYIYIYAFTKTHVCTQACPKLVLQIQRKHRVRTNITRTKNMNIFGSLQKQVNLENLHFGSRRFNGLNTAKGCQGGTIFKHRP